MASTSEVGHNKNAANYKSLYQILEEMGTLYQPTNTTIKLAVLEPKKATITTAINNLNDQNPICKNAVAAREVAIAPLGKLATRVLNSFRAMQVSEPDKQNAESIVKKIRGDKKTKKINPEKASTEAISTSQMSYDSRTANLKELIAFLESRPEYVPSEEDLKIATLKEYYTMLLNHNSLVNQCANQLLTTRTARNNELYYKEDSVINLAPTIKNYLKSIGTPGLPYYKAAVQLKFSDIKK